VDGLWKAVMIEIGIIIEMKVPMLIMEIMDKKQSRSFRQKINHPPFFKENLFKVESGFI
jgi:hypothetical protein